MKWILSLLLGVFLVSCQPEEINGGGNSILGTWTEVEDYNGGALSSIHVVQYSNNPTNSPEGPLDIWVMQGYGLYSPITNKLYDAFGNHVGNVQWLGNNTIVVRISSDTTFFLAGDYNVVNSKYQR